MTIENRYYLQRDLSYPFNNSINFRSLFSTTMGYKIRMIIIQMYLTVLSSIYRRKETADDDVDNVMLLQHAVSVDVFIPLPSLSTIEHDVLYGGNWHFLLGLVIWRC
jgi:hypothetical protein